MPPLIKICGDELPPVVNSTSNFLIVRMVTADSDVAKGFIANYRIVRNIIKLIIILFLRNFH
jgi:hypothetical protein